MRNNCFKRVVLIGSGYHASSCLDLVVSCGYEPYGIVSPKRSSISSISNLQHWHSIEDNPAWEGCSYCIAIGENYKRELVYNKEALPLRESLSFPAFVHSSAYVSPYATIGDGTLVFANAVIGASSSVGRFCIVNTAASLDHDGVMLDFSSLAPGVNIGGCARIGERAALSIGAAVIHGITIGADSLVGAGSVVIRDVAESSVVYGVPASVKRSRKRHDPYL